MTMTEPLTLAQRLEQRAKTMNGSLVGASDGNTYAIGYYDQFAAADDKEAAALIASLRDANKALTERAIEAENDRDRYIEGKVLAECQRDAAEAKLATALEDALRVGEQMLDQKFRADRLSAKLAKVEEELIEERAYGMAEVEKRQSTQDELSRISAELAEARSLLTLVSCIDLNHSTEHDDLLLETVVEDARSFFASKEASHAE